MTATQEILLNITDAVFIVSGIWIVVFTIWVIAVTRVTKAENNHKNEKDYST